MDEFNLIQQYFSNHKSSSTDDSVVLGIGDDTAVIQPPENEELLLTTDTLIKGVHFPENTPPHAIGHKALAVNLSDIAAMGGTARWFTLALSLPDAKQPWLQSFSDGLLELAEKHGVKLVGGDTTCGSLSITITVIGTTPKGKAIRRSGAIETDLIYVTGHPGMAGIGLNSILKGDDTPPGESQSFYDKLNYPQPRLQEGQFIREFATSMIDLSDGLSADIGHVIESSQCGAILDAARLAELVPQPLAYSHTQILKWVLSGGDDYELLFTVPADRKEQLEKEWPAHLAKISCIGTIVSEPGLYLRDNTNTVNKLIINGYNHFND